MAHRPPDTLLRARSRFSQPLVLLDKPKPRPWLSPSRSPTGVVVPPNQLGIQVLRGRALRRAGASAQQRETQAEKGPQHRGSESHGARQAEAGASRAWGASTRSGRAHPWRARCGCSGAGLGLQPSGPAARLSSHAPLPAAARPGPGACVPTARWPSQDRPGGTRAPQEAGASSGSRSGQLGRAPRGRVTDAAREGRRGFQGGHHLGTPVSSPLLGVH